MRVSISARSIRLPMKKLGFTFLSALLFAGCANDPRYRGETVYLGDRRIPDPKLETGRMNFDNVSHWDGDDAKGPPKIRIRLSEQKAYFFKGDQLVGVSILSTGREGFGTPYGTFKVIQKDRDHVSSRYGDYVDKSTGELIRKDVDRLKDPMPAGAKYDGAKMPFFMRVKGGVGMHEGFLPGYPASHGCIRMPGFMAEAFFRNSDVGTPVIIEP